MRRPLLIAAAAVAFTAAAGGGEARATTATAYCLHGTMADGTYTRAGSAASDVLRLGTRITISPSFYGLTRFTIRDTGPALADGHFDLWTSSCSTAVAWGRRTISWRLGWGPSAATLARRAARRRAHDLARRSADLARAHRWQDRARQAAAA